MDIREFYVAVGGGYDEVLARLPLEKMIVSFVKRFPGDGSYGQIRPALRDRNYQEAFRFAHSLKGASFNLGFGSLTQSASALCEALRGGGEPKEGLSGLLGQVDRDYESTVSCIAGLD
jgi:histidine phosphotransfer protein HptB